MDVYISGVGMTKFGRSKEPLEKMMAEAASSALKLARLERVDAIYIGVMSVEEFVGDSNFATLLTDTLGLTGVPSTRVETASSTGAGAFEALGIERYISTALSTGNKGSRSPWTMRVFAVIVER